MRRPMRFVTSLLLVVATFGVFSTRAEAVTLREIIELTKAGLSDEVLLALIEIDQRIFPVDPDTLRSLKDAGVSPAVIVAVVKSGRTPKPQSELPPEPVVDLTPPDPPAPQVVIVDRPVPVIEQVQVPVAVPVYVAVGRRSSYPSSRHRDYDVPASPIVPFPPTGRRDDGKGTDRPDHKRAEPVYWGFGGKLRPDAWQPKK